MTHPLTAADHRAVPLQRARPQRGRVGGRTVVGALVALMGAITLYGLPYYILGSGERLRHPMHAWLRPSGPIGQSAGVIALAIFIFLWLYPVRKKVRWLAWTGSVGRWLDVHVAAALTMPLLVGLHAGWRFDGLIGLGYGAILVVCLSGVVGRYLYVRIPRSLGGVELTREQVTAERRTLLDALARSTGVPAADLERRLAPPARGAAHGVPGILLALARSDLARRRVVRRLRKTLGAGLDPEVARQVFRLASREIALAEQARLLDGTHRVFRLWHVAHRPVALTALLTVTVHLVVVIALGTTWFR